MDRLVDITTRLQENTMTHRPTSRVLDTLEALTRTEQGLTLTELSRTIGASASTITPLLRTLQARAYVNLDKRTMLYSLGPRNLALSGGFANSSDVYSLIIAEMQHLVTRCSETCQLGILDGNTVFYIGKIDSPEPLRLVSSVGKNVPACCTALGKALMSDMSKDVVLALYPEGLPALTSHSLRTVDELYIQIEHVREGGFAEDVEESLEHLRCFALPIRFEGQVDSAVSISSPDFRLNAEKILLVQRCLLETRAAIEEHLRMAGHGLRPMP